MTMMPALPPPAAERLRLAALDGYDVLDASLGGMFDDILCLAQRIFDVPTILLSFVAADRQVLGARIDLDLCEIGLDGSFCTHAILRREVLVVPVAASTPGPRWWPRTATPSAPSAFSTRLRAPTSRPNVARRRGTSPGW